MPKEREPLAHHLQQVLNKERRFENSFQGIFRMIMEAGREKVPSLRGKLAYDYLLFRQGEQHVVGVHEQINRLVNFLKDAADGGQSREMAFLITGEPGNGKTFLVNFLCNKYREFLSKPGNRKYTFRFNNVNEFGNYGDIPFIESQTYEDPMVLAMNFFPDRGENIEYLAEHYNYPHQQLEKLYEDSYRPIGADTAYIWEQLRNHTENDIQKMLEFIEIIPVPIIASIGTITGKYTAGEKLTSTAVDLRGDESLKRLMRIPEDDHPYETALRIGVLARVACDGILFLDEMFKNKKDLQNILLTVIQERVIEIKGHIWPVSMFIIATSNNEVYNEYMNDNKEGPITDRCNICHFPHNTHYKMQKKLTAYSINEKKRTTLTGETMHIDPNLNDFISISFCLSRIPKMEKISMVEAMHLEAGDIAEEKSIQTLIEAIKELKKNVDITKHYGHRGLSHRSLAKAIGVLASEPVTQEGKCMFAYDFVEATEEIIRHYVVDTAFQDHCFKALDEAKKLYRKIINTSVYNAYRDDAEATKKDVMNYINMIIGLNQPELGPDNLFSFIDPQTGERKAIKVDKRYVESVEEKLGKKTEEQRKSFRTNILQTYQTRKHQGLEFDIMGNQDLVDAVTEVRIKSDLAGAAGLIGALSDRTNEDNQALYDRMINTMLKKLKYCKTCAEKTIEYFCTKDDES